MKEYNVKVKSYYMWLEDKNKKISDIHPGADGKTSEIISLSFISRKGIKGLDMCICINLMGYTP